MPLNFTGNAIQQTPSLIPQQQIVVPPITIPQGFQAKSAPQTVVQMTAKGKENARKVPLGPNSRAAIFEEDPEVSVFYYRETDEYGNDSDFGVYKFEKVEDPPEPEYLTKQEFYSAMDEFVKKIKEETAHGESVREATAGGTGWYADK